MSKKNLNKLKTTSDIILKPFYGKNNPGEYPFTSGIYPNMYRDKLWTMRQYAGFTSVEKSNERYHYLLKQLLLFAFFQLF